MLFGVLIGQGAEKQKNLGAIPESGKAYRPHLGPSHLRIQYVLGAVAPGVKLLGLTVHLRLEYVMIVEGSLHLCALKYRPLKSVVMKVCTPTTVTHTFYVYSL